MPVNFLDDFLDDDSLQWQCDLRRFRKQHEKATLYWESYNLRYDYLVGAGVALSDPNENDVGSDANMHAWSEALKVHPEDDNPWETRFNSGGYLPRLTPLETNGVDRTWERHWSESFVALESWDQWIDWVGSIYTQTVVLDDEDRFWIGMAQRVSLRSQQIRAAANLLNVFCLDNRGRPA